MTLSDRINDRLAAELDDYRSWMGMVDAALLERCGLSSADLPDYRYRDAFEADEDPTDVALAVLEDAGYDDDSDY